MSELAERTLRHARLWNAGAPDAAPATQVVKTRRVLTQRIIEIREQRARFDQAMRETLARGVSGVGAAHFGDDSELEELLRVVPTWRRIASEVAQKHGVSVLDLISHRRISKCCVARHEAFWRCRSETTMSLPLIGRKFGGRDHTTVLHGVRKHEERMRQANG